MHFRLLYASADLPILYLFGLTIKGHLWPRNTSALAPPSFRFHSCACVHETLSLRLPILVRILPLCLCCCIRSQPSVRALVVLLSPSHLVCHPLPVSSVALHPFPSFCVPIKSRLHVGWPKILILELFVQSTSHSNSLHSLPIVSVSLWLQLCSEHFQSSQSIPNERCLTEDFDFRVISTLRTLSVCSLIGCGTADSSLHTRTSSCLPVLVGVFLGCVSHSEASLVYHRSNSMGTIQTRMDTFTQCRVQSSAIHHTWWSQLGKTACRAKKTVTPCWRKAQGTSSWKREQPVYLEKDN